MRRTAWLATALVLTAAACSAGDDADPGSGTADAPAAAPDGGDDVARIARYELTMDRVDRLFAAQRAIALAIRDMPEAERTAMQELDMNDASLAEFGERLESIPGVEAALDDVGISGREYATATMAMVSAAMASSLMQMRPNDNQDSLARAMNANMDNVEFMRENEAELARKQQALEAELQGIGALDEE